MENPSYWGEAERLIHIVIEQHQQETDQVIYGGSLEFDIARALQHAGLLRNSPHVEHNHFTSGFEPRTCEACAATNTGKRMLNDAQLSDSEPSKTKTPEDDDEMHYADRGVKGGFPHRATDCATDA